MKQLWKFTEAEVKVTKQFALNHFISIDWYISVKISRLLKWIFWEWFNVFVQDLKETYKRALTLKIHCGQTKIYFNFSFCTFNLHHLLHIHPNFQVSTANTFRVNKFSFGRHQLSTRSFLISVLRHSHISIFIKSMTLTVSKKEFGDCTWNPLGAVTMGVSMAACAALSWSAGAESDDLNPQPFGFTQTFTWNCNCIFNLSRLK